jgi:hypothetical protein
MKRKGRWREAGRIHRETSEHMKNAQLVLSLGSDLPKVLGSCVGNQELLFPSTKYSAGLGGKKESKCGLSLLEEGQTERIHPSWEAP